MESVVRWDFVYGILRLRRYFVAVMYTSMKTRCTRGLLRQMKYVGLCFKKMDKSTINKYEWIMDKMLHKERNNKKIRLHLC